MYTDSRERRRWDQLKRYLLYTFYIRISYLYNYNLCLWCRINIYIFFFWLILLPICHRVCYTAAPILHLRASRYFVMAKSAADRMRMDPFCSHGTARAFWILLTCRILHIMSAFISFLRQPPPMYYLDLSFFPSSSPNRLYSLLLASSSISNYRDSASVRSELAQPGWSLHSHTSWDRLCSC